MGRAPALHVAGRNEVPNTGATGLGGLCPPSLRDAAVPQSHPMETPPSGGVRDSDIQVHSWRSNQLQAQRCVLGRRNPDHPKYTGFKNITAYECMYVFSFERNGCCLAQDREVLGTGSSGIGRINRDRAQLQGAQDPAVPRERQYVSNIVSNFMYNIERMLLILCAIFCIILHYISLNIAHKIKSILIKIVHNIAHHIAQYCMQFCVQY